jgi:hypothetical protein
VHGRVELLLGLPICLGMRGDLTVLCSDLMHINPSYMRALGFPTPGAYRLGIRAGLPLGATLQRTKLCLETHILVAT